MEKLIRGGVYLARLDPSKGAEIGKLRPVVVLTDQVLLDVSPPLIFVCPLSSRSDPAFSALHVSLPPRDNIHRPSFALVEHCRGISRSRVQSERLGQTTTGEMAIILHRLMRMAGG